MSTYPHLAAILIYDVSRRRSMYINICVTTSSLEDVGAPRAMVTFLVELVLLNLECGRYMVPLLPDNLAEMVSGRRVGGGGRGGGGSGSRCCGSIGIGGSGRGGGGNGGRLGGAGRGCVGAGSGGARGAVRVRVHYEAHLPSLTLQGGGKSSTILEGTFLPKVQVRVLFNNWHLCRLCWEDCNHKNSHVPTTPGVAAAITRLLKKSRGE